MSVDKFDCCGFCPTERRDLYKCPRCSLFYCSTRCYRNRNHLQCSERFYRVQCEEDGGTHAKSNKQQPSAEPVNRPTTTFEEYMKQHQAPAGTSIENSGANPQIRVDPNEEIVFDSDDEPDYLTDVARASADQFDQLDMNELDRRLLAAGISPEMASSVSGDQAVDEQQLMESLYGQLTAEEQRSFAQLANDMIGDGSGGASMTSCFRPPPTNFRRTKKAAVGERSTAKR